MQTQVESALAGVVTPTMQTMAEVEGLPAARIRDEVARGRIVIPNNRNRASQVVGIGKGLRTKVNASIGAAQSARYGADLICYITPAEHLALPNEADVIEGVKTARLAAHIGDLTKYPERTRTRDLAMSKARRDLDWPGQFAHALFGQDAIRIRGERHPQCDSTGCTMCGEFCANRASNKLFSGTLQHSPKA
jgi:thiamine biosynthesis protein ThiC